MRTVPILVAATAATALLAGCSNTSDGTPQAEGADTAVVDDMSFDESTLDTGDYKTEPRDFEADGQLAEDFGPAVEGQRMAEFVILPHDIDPRLTEGAGMNNGVGVGGIAKSGLTNDAAKKALEPFEVITTFTDFRSTPDDTYNLGISVWRFPDADQAAQAAAALHAAEITPPAEDDLLASGPGTEVNLPTLPGTLASTYRWDSLDTDTMSTFTARGPHVIYTYVSAEAGDTAWVADVTTRAVEKQIPLIDEFPFTPTDQIGALPVDVDKVLARAVGFLENEYASNSDTAVYGDRGWLHFDSDPEETAALFEETGTDRIASANSNVYRTDGPESAAALRDAFVEQTLDAYPDLVEESAPQGVPDTICHGGDTADGRLSKCFMVYGPYLAELTGFRAVGNTDPDDDTLRTMPQRVGAQYVKFTRAEELGLGRN